MRRWSIILALSSMLLGGCSSEPWLEVVIDGRGLDHYGRLDGLVVWVAAADNVGSAEPETCRSAERVFEAPDGLEFPISVVFVQSDREWDCVALDVVGFDVGVPVIHSEGLYCDWAQSESVTLTLEPACDRRSSGEPPDCDDNVGPYPATCTLIGGEPQCVASRAIPLIHHSDGSDRSCDSVD